uniref:Uncharacterized protein n=1 Tax=Arundo donax TaxID=35708 RepID=A0A0A9A072_ARUDO
MVSQRVVLSREEGEGRAISLALRAVPGVLRVARPRFHRVDELK